jgi:hypothetical protein
MNLLQLFVGIIMVFGWQLVPHVIGNKRIFITTILLTASFITTIIPEIKEINLLATLLELAAISIIISELYFKKKNSLSPIGSLEADQERNKVIKFAGVVMAILAIHNFFDISYLLDASNLETVSVLSPWGLFFVLLIVSYTFSAKSNSGDYDLANSSFFRGSVFSFSIAFSLVVTLVFFDLMPGNTDKVALGIGGVGLAGKSTNETGLIACCLILWLLRIQKLRGISLLGIVSLVSLAGMVLLTQSRIGIVSLFIITLCYLFYNRRLRTRDVVFAALIIAALSIPAISVMVERMSADSGISTKIEGGDLGGSGRGFIWFSYLDAFTSVASEKPYTWLLGVGPAGVAELYGDTYLRAFKIEVANGTYYPLHSDVVFTFLSTGFIGLFCWIALVITVTIKLKRHGFNFSNISAITIFVFYSFGDMLIYSPLAVWLLTQAIVSPLDNAPVLQEKLVFGSKITGA